jgi:uncharacterized protein YjbI with pentapeptide repeats
MGNPSRKTEVPLKPRWRAWRGQWPWSIPLLLALVVYQFRGAREYLYPLSPTLALNVLYFLGLAWYIAREHRQRPPTMHFWEDGSPFAVTVRNRNSGKVIMRSAVTSLADQDLSEVPLRSGTLQGLDLKRVDLCAGDLSGADLRGATLTGAQLANANLRGANMEGTGLGETNLSGADLRNVRFGFCVFTDTDFRGADLRGANFVGGGMSLVVWSADLGGADFRGALYDRTTRWPLGFNPRAHGCILARDSTHELPIPSEAEARNTDNLPVTVEGAQTEVCGVPTANAEHQTLNTGTNPD